MRSTPEQELREQGYCVARNCLDRATLDTVERLCGRALAEVTEQHRAAFKAQGSLIEILDYPDFAEVIAHPALAALLAGLGLHGSVFHGGYIFSKPPGAPSLFWHQDWWGWDDLASYSARIGQVNVMIYLSATAQENGCLRVLPGSHRRSHPVHAIPAVYGAELCRVDDPGHVLYQSRQDEQAIPVQSGDVVVMDTRLLHGTYANVSGDHRTMVSLQYNPDYAALPAAIRERIRMNFLRQGGGDGDLYTPLGRPFTQWPEKQRKMIEHLLPTGAEGVSPLGYNFRPAPELFEKARTVS